MKYQCSRGLRGKLRHDIHLSLSDIEREPGGDLYNGGGPGEARHCPRVLMSSLSASY